MSGFRALVTGASGFIGSNLCRRLLNDGAEVHATSRSPRETHHAGLRWWRNDLASQESARALVREIRPDVIFHLAGQVSAAPDLQFVEPAFQSLLGSTVRLLTAATELGCRRVVAIGSLTEPHRDGAESVPSSPYAAAKWGSSAYARMFHALYGTPVVIARVFMTYGPGQHPDKLVPHVIRSLLRDTPPRLASGRYTADWIYVDDVVHGLTLAATRPGVEGATIDIGSGALITTRELVSRIAARIGSDVQPEFGALPDRPDEPLRSADLRAARERLGWQAETSLDEGLDRTIAWYRERQGGTGSAS